MWKDPSGFWTLSDTLETEEEAFKSYTHNNLLYKKTGCFFGGKRE